ncbi:MAG: thymidine phosphorylase [Gemmatimonadaceae bacterium]|nr:thymidine phosphorylase [Gemmatimonadaceae bacterium]MCW5825970.1 thymidine phosphorylase [Gemmatimonadaceae bacterium]
MTVVELIERKRNGGRLTAGELRALMRAYADGEVPDYQMSAFAMAVYFRGMDDEEIGALTAAMLESGRSLDLTHLGVPRVDKHSTGGVGDKVSLILAPLVAACGVAVPMMSGRGLGHTGGTLDKLESIPGFRTRLTLEETVAQLERLGVAMIGQTREIAPADRKFYALRDATATVEAIPLIAASIMSKKLAEGLTGLVLDVKTGAGAFMTKLEDSLTLAQTMIALGERRGCPTVALLTDMDSPLGEACGNALEVEESIHCLRGEGPADLREVTLALAAEMLLVAGAASDQRSARQRAESALGSGAALEKFREIVQAQGGHPGVVDNPVAILPRAPIRERVEAARSGIVQRVEPRIIGRAIIDLGGGRTRVEDEVDPAVGIVLHVRPGGRVERGQPIATVHARDADGRKAAEAALRQAVVLGEQPPARRPLISHRVTRRGVEELPAVGAH